MKFGLTIAHVDCYFLVTLLQLWFPLECVPVNSIGVLGERPRAATDSILSVESEILSIYFHCVLELEFNRRCFFERSVKHARLLVYSTAPQNRSLKSDR